MGAIQSQSLSDTDRFLRAIADSITEAETPVQTKLPDIAASADTVAFTAAERLAAAQNTSPQNADTFDVTDGPVNPLVAARVASNRASANSGGSDDLYPISEVDAQQGTKGFDTSFGKKSKAKTVFITLIVLILLALIVFGAYYAWRYKTTTDAQAKIDNAIEKLVSTDDVITGIDAVLATEVDNGSYTAKLSDYMMRTTTTISALNNAEAFANDALRDSSFLDEASIDGLHSIKTSIAARRTLIDVARTVSSTDTKTQQVLQALNNAYESLRVADESAQTSGDQFYAYALALGAEQDVSDVNLWELTQYDNTAIWSTQSAQEQVAAAKELMSELDVSALTTYIEARLVYLDTVLQFHSAYAEGNTALAGELAQTVTSTQEAATAAQASVPANYQSAISNVYSNSTKAQQDAYNKARNACVAADSSVAQFASLVSFGVPSEKEYAEAAAPKSQQQTVANTEVPTEVQQETEPAEVSAEEGTEAGIEETEEENPLDTEGE